MNTVNSEILARANEAAIYNIYAYLARYTTPTDSESLLSVTAGLETDLKNPQICQWKYRDIYRLSILKNAIAQNRFLADSKISNLTRSKSGLTACSFTNPSGEVFVVFRGTGKGEWIDNGEGLSGIPEENTYIIYGKNGREISRKTVKNDYATDQQVEALNWYRSIYTKSGWNKNTKITLCGHSKGGNKAQFITIQSDSVYACYSFDGQGFSPEAIAALKHRAGVKFEMRSRKILSFSSDNDYVNVLGLRLMPQQNIHFFESSRGFHYLEAMLDINGRFNRQCEQGKLSLYIEEVSNQIMSMRPAIRQYAALGVMNIFQKFLGEGAPVNGDSVSVEETIAGIGVAIIPLLDNLRKMKEGEELL